MFKTTFIGFLFGNESAGNIKKSGEDSIFNQLIELINTSRLETKSLSLCISVWNQGSIVSAYVLYENGKRDRRSNSDIHRALTLELEHSVN